MSTSFTTLNELSASDGFYALDTTAPVLSIINYPANKINPTQITVNVSAYDIGGIALSGISVNGFVTPISGFTTTDTGATFFFNVTATGSIEISATDIAGNISSLTSTNYLISGVADTIPPVIEFKNSYPTGKAVSEDSIGSVHVKVTDNMSIAADPSNFVFLDGSVSSVTPISAINFQQTYPNVVEFDITNIVKSGTIILSARDDAGNGTSASDGPWISQCADGKKINLTNYLPSYLKESEMLEFTQFFEDFLNTMYEDKLKGCNYSILEKIDRLKTFKDPDAIDAEYFQYFANHFGYEVDINKETVGEFSISASDDASVNDYIRLSLKNIPSFNKIKTTEDAIQVILFSFGVVAELLYLWTNDYKTVWFQESRSDPINVRNEIPKTVPAFYPTPHFRIAVNYTKTSPTWTQNYDKIIKVFNNIKSINTVLRGLAGYFEPVIQLPSDPLALGYQFAVSYTGQIEVPWGDQPIGTFVPLDFVDRGISYKAVKIGNQVWMAENFKAPVGTYTQLSNSATYGFYYDWNTANSSAPSGWHLPTQNDIFTLLDNTVSGGGTTVYDQIKMLKAINPLWTINDGTDNFGFSALPAGFYNYGLVQEHNYAQWWTSTSANVAAHYVFTISQPPGGGVNAYSVDSVHYNVRYIKD